LQGGEEGCKVVGEIVGRSAMTGLCSICGKPLKEGEGPICKACEEQIRAEAAGRRQQVARDAARVTGGIEERVGKGKKPLSLERHREDEKEKAPRDFGSLAEYLEYLKGRRD